MATRQALIGTRFRTVVDTIWPAIGAEGTPSTFTLRRLTATGPKDDLGTTPASFQPLITGQPCIVTGLFQQDERWTITTQGQLQNERVELWTSYIDVHEGDEILLALDGKTYLVQDSEYCGTLRKCVLTSAEGRSG